MPRLEDLPPDLRATLSLLVDRGKSYAQVAELLGIPERAVRDRAHAALDALAGAPGQSDAPSPPAATSPAPRGSSSGSGPASSSRGGLTPRGAGLGSSDAIASLPVSKRGGAFLLAGIAVIVVVAVILLSSGGGSSNSSSTNTTTSTSASTTTPTHSKASTSTSEQSKSKSKSTGAKANVTNQLTLTPADPTSKSIGIAEVLAEGSQHAVYVAAEHLPPTHGFFYVLWLTGSSSGGDQAIGKTTVGSTGRLQAGALLPTNAGDYHQILLARETNEHSTTPGPTVLSGAFSLTKSG
jgi:hypothetical protein